jgi:Tfp pilus assembly protein PilX
MVSLMRPLPTHGPDLRTVERLRDESGIALIMALGIMLVLTIALTTVIFLAAASARDSHRTNAGQKAYALAESGVNNALAVLYPYYSTSTDSFPGSPCLLHPQALPTTYAGYDASADASACGTNGSPYESVYNAGSCAPSVTNNCVTWSGALQPVTGQAWDWQWVIRSTGSVRNPTGPSVGNLTRTVTVKVPLIPGDSKIGSDSILQWVYAKTDLIFNNSVGVSAPVFAVGNLTVQNSAVICGSAGKVYAGGYLNNFVTQDQVGQVNDPKKCPQPDPKVAEVHVAGDCWYGNGPHHPTCGPADNVFATTSDKNYDSALATTLANSVPQPSIALQNAKPGPNHPCTSFAPSGNPPPFSFNLGGNSLNTPGNPIDLTPSASYSCKVMIGSQPIGELSWDNGTKVLTVQGNIYIDGSATVSQTASYKGRGLLFLTGIFVMDANGETLCAIPNGTDCDTAPGKWDPNVNVLVIYALGSDGKSPPPKGPNGVVLKGKVQFQGGLLANNAINLDTNAIAQGPMDSVNGFVNAGQNNDISFPAIKILPGGVETSTSPGKLMLPRDFSGG